MKKSGQKYFFAFNKEPHPVVLYSYSVCVLIISKLLQLFDCLNVLSVFLNQL